MLGCYVGSVEKYHNYVEKDLRYRVFFMVFFSTFNVAIMDNVGLTTFRVRETDLYILSAVEV